MSADRRSVGFAWTVNPSAVRDASNGPQLSGVCAVHIHTGKPTSPAPAGSGAIPISAPDSGSMAMTCSIRLPTIPSPEGKNMGVGQCTYGAPSTPSSAKQAAL